MIETISPRDSHDEEISCLQENYKLLADAVPAALTEIVGIGNLYISPFHWRHDVSVGGLVDALRNTHDRLIAESNINSVREVLGDTRPATAVVYCMEKFLPILFSSMGMMSDSVVWQIRVCREMDRPDSLYVTLGDIRSPGSEPVDLDWVIGRVDVDMEGVELPPV